MNKLSELSEFSKSGYENQFYLFQQQIFKLEGNVIIWTTWTLHPSHPPVPFFTAHRRPHNICYLGGVHLGHPVPFYFHATHHHFSSKLTSLTSSSLDRCVYPSPALIFFMAFIYLICLFIMFPPLKVKLPLQYKFKSIYI